LLREPLQKLTPSTITTPRALRSQLKRVRELGYAATVDEMEQGLAGVSVGIFNETRMLIGVINVSGLSQRLDTAGRQRAVEHVRRVVEGLEAALGRASPCP
jgi:DNA-binding IclR family transcriptional regulator